MNGLDRFEALVGQGRGVRLRSGLDGSPAGTDTGGEYGRSNAFVPGHSKVLEAAISLVESPKRFSAVAFQSSGSMFQRPVRRRESKS